MEDFKQQLSDDATDSDARTLEQIEAGLAGLRLEKKVADAAQARAQFWRQRFWRRVMFGVLVAAIWGLGWLVWQSQKSPALPIHLPGKMESQPIENQQVDPKNLPSEKATPAPQKPIAERPKTPRERAEQPLVRSAKPDLDEATNRLIDLSLKYTLQVEGKPGADKFARSIWGPAVRALLANQPAEAKTHIFELEKTDAPEAQWLLAIALLEEGKSDAAEAIFQKIAANPNHARRELAASLVAMMRQD